LRRWLGDVGHGSRLARRALLALVVLWAPLRARADWTVTERLALPRSGAPVDLSSFAKPGEDPVRVVLSGTYSFALDGSRIDAMGATTRSGRDVAVGPFVRLPPGARVVASDPAAHRYTVEVPRAEHMAVALNVIPLAMRHLIGVREARDGLVGAIEVEHLVTMAEAIGVVPDHEPSAVVGRRADGGVPVAWVAVVLGLVGVGSWAGWRSRRRRGAVRSLRRRARRAHRAIVREIAALGPAFDPVGASVERLLEVVEQHAAHHGALTRALSRTAWTRSAEADGRRRALSERRAEVLRSLAAIVDRMEGLATDLAARGAESTRARGAEALMRELSDELDTVASVNRELASL